MVNMKTETTVVLILMSSKLKSSTDTVESKIR